jgi:hypothetical protein
LIKNVIDYARRAIKTVLSINIPCANRLKPRNILQFQKTVSDQLHKGKHQ